MKAKTLSKSIVFLFGARLILVQFRDVSLFDIAGYSVSLLSIWSGVFLILAFHRLLFKPGNPPNIKWSIIAFFVFVFTFGVSRIFAPSALIRDILYMTQFFVAILVASKLIFDLGINYIAKRITLASLLLITMHITAHVWDKNAIGLDPHLGNYLGAFESKHIAADTFLAICPYVFFRYLSNRKIRDLILFLAIIFFLVFTFQRTSILTFFVIAFVFLSKSKHLSLKWYLLAAVIPFLIFYFIPTESMDKFAHIKFQEEFNEASAGNINAIGAGRTATIFLAGDWFVNKFGLFEQFFGLGTAYNYTLNLTNLGVLNYAHVQIIQLIIDYGLVGLVLAFTIMIKIYKRKKLLYLQNDSFLHTIAFAMCVGILAKLFYAMPLMDGGNSTLFAFWLFPEYTFAHQKKLKTQAAISDKIIRLDDVEKSERNNGKKQPCLIYS